MVIVGYMANKQGDIMVDSRGGACWITGGNLCQVLDYLLEQHGEEGAVFKVAWDIDQLAIPVIQMLSPQVLKQLAETEACEVIAVDAKGRDRRYRIWYPRQDGVGQCLSITDKLSGPFGDRDEAIIWHIQGFMPDGMVPPASAEETEDYARKVINIFARQLGFQPTPKRFFSPVNVVRPYLEQMSLPKLVDLPSKAANFAAKCMMPPWVEAVKLGSWEHVWDVDQTNAYASVLQGLPDTRLGTWKQGGYQKDALLGYIHCDYEIFDNVTLHPIIEESDDETGACATVGVHRDRYITKSQAEFIRFWKIGRVDLKEGVWWFPTASVRRPLWTVIERLKQQRAEMDANVKEVDRAIGRMLAKRVMTGMWGYTARWDWAAGKEPDAFFNPPWAAEITTRVALRDAHFIYRHKLVDSVINVAVDGFMSECDPGLVAGEDPGWKVSGEGPALVVSATQAWFGGKRPEGRLLSEVLALIQASPKSSSWTWSWQRTATLGDCLQRHNFGILGQTVGCQSTLHLRQDRNRDFRSIPRSGSGLLSRKYDSVPLKEGNG